MKDKPLLYAGLAAVSVMILAGTGVGLTVMMLIFVVLSPILVCAIITLSLLTTGFLASVSLGASSIAFFFWLYKNEKQYIHAQDTQHEKANKLVGGNKSAKEDRPNNKLAEENKSSVKEKLVEEDKPPINNETPEVNNPTEEDKPREGVLDQAKEKSSMLEISKVRSEEEQNPNVPKCCGSSTCAKRSHPIEATMDYTKVRSTFIKEYQKVPRVGAFAYKYLTSRDKIT